jgi:hypothetical protein
MPFNPFMPVQPLTNSQMNEPWSYFQWTLPHVYPLASAIIRQA